jgi:N-acetylated-alpha-linked acidic dipeptidase
MKQTQLLLLLGFALLFSGHNIEAQRKSGAPLIPDTSRSQASIESRFDRLLQTGSIGDNIRQLSSEPHHLGSAGGKRVAEAILAKFKEYGWSASIETYQVLFPTPKTRVLELVAPTQFKAGLQELPEDGDATSAQSGQLPTYVAWSADGDVTADLVYVNFGLPEDYAVLDRLGISVNGKIVIARYGKSWRGTKPKIAYEHGAVGCILYSDPKEDGYFQGDVYPKGAFKNENMVQRGSVMDFVIYPGDPLTPGIGATETAKRLSRAEAPTILKIPVQPISYHDALPLLSALEGTVAPADWRGALPITYKIGGTGNVKLHLNVAFNWDLVPAYDVIAKIKGTEYPDQWVIRGNHHDAWVNGAADPIGGQASLLEEAKAIGQLVKAGFKPKRTLVYCAWDGEEPSLLGSTEWAEDHQKELAKKAVAYINTDGGGKGFLGVEGSLELEHFITDISKDVSDPETGVSLFERRRAADAVQAPSAKQKQEALSRTTFPLGALGAGSDYSVFNHHIGIPTLSIAFGGESDGGEYHSIFDSYDDYVRFKDPGFVYGVALSKVVGRAVLRLANADLFPLDYRSLHKDVDSYLAEVRQLANQMKEQTVAENRLIASGAYKLASDPQKNQNAPSAKDSVPSFDFSVLQASLDSLGKSARILFELQEKLANISDPRKDKVNESLAQSEKALLIDSGLPRRPWYKHAIYAPGFYTGYGVKTLPGIREAIEERHWQEAREQIETLTSVVRRLTSTIDSVIISAKEIVGSR